MSPAEERERGLYVRPSDKEWRRARRRDNWTFWLFKVPLLMLIGFVVAKLFHLG